MLWGKSAMRVKKSVLSVFVLFFLQRCCFICHFGIQFSKRHNLLYFRANCFPCDIIPSSVLLDTIFWVKFFGLFSVVKLNCADWTESNDWSSSFWFQWRVKRKTWGSKGLISSTKYVVRVSSQQDCRLTFLFAINVS